MLPAYLFSCLYLWKICEDETVRGVSRWGTRLTGILGSLYAIWLIYAAGLNYMLMAIEKFTPSNYSFRGFATNYIKYNINYHYHDLDLC